MEVFSMDGKMYHFNSRGYFIEYARREQSDHMPTNHYHDHFEIYYQLYGERYYFIKDRSYYVKKGDLVLINAYDLHKTLHIGNQVYERIVINFSLDYLLPFIDSITDIPIMSCFNYSFPILSLSSKQQFFIETLLSKMLYEYKGEQAGSETYNKISLIELLIWLNRIKPTQKNNYLEFPSSLHKKISTITSYINHHFHENLSLEQVAKQFSMNNYYLCRTFKEVTGFHFSKYINTVRIRASEDLLLNTSLSILEIAIAVGYSNSTHFGRVFKSQLGVSPLQYRKHNKKLVNTRKEQ